MPGPERGFPTGSASTSDDRLMTSLPLFHINAPAYSVLGSLACGAGLVLLPRFSASGFLDAARRHGATEFNAIGAMLEILMRQPERPDDADTDLRLCYTGPVAHAGSGRRLSSIGSGFASSAATRLSESPYGLIWRKGTRPFGSLGSPRQHPTLGTVNEVRVIDDAGQDVPTGGSGELLLRNPVVTPGYWGMPEETAAAVVDGWLHTGDLVTVNGDDTYTFVARQEGGAAPARAEPVAGRDRGGHRRAPRRARGRRRRGALGADRGRGEGVRRRHPRCRPRLRRAARVGSQASFRVQGAAVLAGCRRTPEDADLAGGQASAAARTPARRVRRRAPRQTRQFRRRRDNSEGQAMTGYRDVDRNRGRNVDQVLGQDLAGDLMGKVGFAELAYWLVALRRPTAGELRCFESVLVALADHGLTPQRPRRTPDPDGCTGVGAGALAAGLLGGGSRFLGVTEDTGRFLSDALGALAESGSPLPDSPAAWDALALDAVRAQRAAGRLVPGLGHTLHKHGDPRTPVLFAIAKEEGLFGPHLQLFEAVGRVHPEVLGRTLPLNGAGACGAALCDLGLPVEILRGFALLARTAGLLGHLAEEMREPIGLDLYAQVEHETVYEPPQGDAGTAR